MGSGKTPWEPTSCPTYKDGNDASGPKLKPNARPEYWPEVHHERSERAFSVTFQLRRVAVAPRLDLLLIFLSPWKIAFQTRYLSSEHGGAEHGGAGAEHGGAEHGTDSYGRTGDERRGERRETDARRPSEGEGDESERAARTSPYNRPEAEQESPRDDQPLVPLGASPAPPGLPPAQRLDDRLHIGWIRELGRRAGRAGVSPGERGVGPSRDRDLDPVVHRVRTDRSYRQATDPDRVAVLSPDMRRVRASQQAAAAERALAAEEERIAKAKAERERKRVMTPTEERFEKRGGEGTRLGDDGTKKEGGGSGVGRNGTAAGSSRSTGGRREPRAPPPGSSFGSSNQSGM
ncbi:hypothetical protein THAOC_08151 [Thalassiosira oceanica]|uniref:Uncharacterized protein n=1 Tax=Thalassiosira oceanica TaxID=159749 RepID=K0SYL0_THAOC|nr:hypothetical protein THAOC_08151 [Thalassiosira oceanica]|eukprot:EJK70485.1 hypothetical protein THAOC_08151 [Thalassiosira oceanica]